MQQLSENNLPNVAIRLAEYNGMAGTQTQNIRAPIHYDTMLFRFSDHSGHQNIKTKIKSFFAFSHFIHVFAPHFRTFKFELYTWLDFALSHFIRLHNRAAVQNKVIDHNHKANVLQQCYPTAMKQSTKKPTTAQSNASECTEWPAWHRLESEFELHSADDSHWRATISV